MDDTFQTIPGRPDEAACLPAEDSELAAKYRMPRWFGRAPGPRNVPAHAAEMAGATDMLNVSITALSEAEPLLRLLPPRCVLRGEPTFTVQARFLTNIGWLAGRGYNIMMVSIPVTYTGAEETVHGDFVAAMWESHADPIITGREELGFSKLFADIEGPGDEAGRYQVKASWDGFPFLELDVRETSEQAPPAAANPTPSAGGLHYKFIPKTGAQGEADVEYMVLTATPPPPKPPQLASLRTAFGEGRFAFHKARWEDMPTQYHVVSALAALPVREFRAATIRDVSLGASTANALEGARRLR